MKTNHKLKIDYKRCHEGLWNWLADNPDKDKEDWPGLKTIIKFQEQKFLPEMPFQEHFNLHKCFACQTVKHHEWTLQCSMCPVNFGKKNCDAFDSYFNRWMCGYEVSANARKIAQGWKK